MSSLVKQLEARAIDAHRAGVRWRQFLAEHGGAMAAAEPISLQRFHRLTGRLLALVVSGDLDGFRPIDVGPAWGGSPWEADAEN